MHLWQITPPLPMLQMEWPFIVSRKLDRKIWKIYGTILNRIARMGIKIPENQKEVNMCKAVREWREELLTEGKAEGEAIGTVKGEAKLARLIAAMSEQGDSANIAQIATDPVFRAKMYAKYGIE